MNAICGFQPVCDLNLDVSGTCKSASIGRNRDGSSTISGRIGLISISVLSMSPMVQEKSPPML